MDQDILRHLRRWKGTSLYPVIVLGGPSGIGKTTQARIMCRDLGIPYTSHDLHGNARDFLQHLAAILKEHGCAIVDRVFLDGNMAWIQDLRTIFGETMDVALFPIFPVIHEALVEVALQNMEKRTHALETTDYADEPYRVKCGKTMEDRRKILMKQLASAKPVPRAAYVEIVDGNKQPCMQRSVTELAFAYREALMGLLHQYCYSGSKKRKMEGGDNPYPSLKEMTYLHTET